MRRRDFIKAIGVAGVPWLIAGRAQPAIHVPTIGFLGPSTAPTALPRVAAFSKRLAQLGWIDGRTVAISYRWADGHSERFSELAAELVRREVDVIATWGTATAVAAKQQTSVIPIVFTVVGDPVGSGLVASLARPGGNVTGLSTQHDDTAGKRLQFLREIVPNLRRLAIMANKGNSGSILEVQQLDAAARAIDIETTKFEFQRQEDIASAIELASRTAQALYVAADAFVNTNRVRINTLTLAARLPTMHGFQEIVADGGLMSYAPNYLDLFRRAADLVDKVLRGAKPADIPVEQPTKFDFIINVTTAKALGLTVPPKLLALADEVIE